MSSTAVPLTTEDMPKSMVALQFPRSVSAVISEGQVIAGASTSVTVTSCVQLVVFPEPSVTVHVTVVVPSG